MSGKKREKWLLLGAFFWGSARLVCGEEVSPPATQEITVTATRIPESLTVTPPAISVVTAQEIKARGATTVAEAIKIVPGVSISDYGPPGALQTVSIRGSTSNEVLVLIDGVRLNSALSGAADLSGLSVDNIDRIEVLREGGSALYGGDALGGVINIITKKKASPFVLTLENGAYIPANHIVGYGFSQTDEPPDFGNLVDSQKAMFSWSPRAGDVQFRTAGTFNRAANAYTFLDSNGNLRELQNAGMVGGDGSLGVSAPWWEGTLSADLAGAYDQKGTPGEQSSPTLSASETDSSGRASVKYSADRFLADEFSLDASLHAEYTGIDYVDSQTPTNDGNNKVYVIGGDLQQTATLSDTVSFVYGSSASFTQGQSVVGTPQRLAEGAFVEPVWEWGSFSLRPALRYDYYSDFFSTDPWGGLGATVAVAYRVSPTDVVKLNLSRSYRVPTFEDLYWPAADGAQGNPDLKPETGYAVDVGFSRQNGNFSYTATAYVRYAQDVILWQQDPDGIWRPSNYGVALYPGLEQEVKTVFADHYTASVNYAFLYSYVLENLSLADNKRLPLTPVHNLNGTLAYDKGPLSWSVTGKYSSLRFLTTANATYLPDYFTLDAFAKWKYSDAYAVYVAVDNLFGEQYQIVEDYPMPTTRIRLGMEIRL
jgi:outer membrane cobalamin receptor